MLLKSKKSAISGVVIIVIIAIAFIVFFYKPQPTGNPFDPVFNVSVNSLKEHKGYIREKIEYYGGSDYYKTVPNGRMYYQEWGGDILAKGCQIILDTLCIACANDTTVLLYDTIHKANGSVLIPETQGERNWDDTMTNIKSYKSYTLFKFDTLLINKRLKPFEASIIDTSIKHGEFYYEFMARHIPTGNIVDCYIEINKNSTRTIEVFIDNPQPFSEKPVIKFFTTIFKKQDEMNTELPEAIGN